MSAPFNPDRLTWARSLVGMNQAALAKEAGVTQGAISQIENALFEPNPELVERLANALKRPTSFFYRASGRKHVPERFYRRKASVLRRDLTHLDAELSLLGEHLEVLHRAVQLKASATLPRLDVATYGSVENVAAALRSTWGIPSGPIRNLVQWVESAGIIVVHVELDFGGLDGLGVRYVGLPPIIFLNSSASADRQRLTLAHELGHLVMHDVPSPNDEEEAKAFQREFLAPARELRRELAPVNLARLGQLKLRWGISMGALLYAAYQMGLVSKGRYIAMNNDLKAMTIRHREPPEYDVPLEQPGLLTKLIELHLNQLGYTPESLAKALDLYPEDFQMRYLRTAGRLRLVRSATR